MNFNKRHDNETDNLEEVLTRLLVTIIEGETKLETSRTFIGNLDDFSLKEAFARIDYKNKGVITAQDIKKFLIGNSVYVNDHYIHNFINFHEGSSKSTNVVSPHLSFVNFSNFVLSKFECDLSNKIIYSDNNNPNFSTGYLSYEVESSLSTLLEEELLLIERISKLLDEFYINPQFKIYSIVRKLDSSIKTYIDEVDIEDYLNKNDLDYSRNDCKLILYRLDKDLDSKIKYEELKFVFKTHLTAALKGVSEGKKNRKNAEVINAQNYQNINKERELDLEYTKMKKKKNYDKDGNNKFKRDSSSNSNTRTISFFNYIEDLLQFETKIEEIKISLAICNDLVIKELFYLFDDFYKQHAIDKLSFKKTLNKFFIFPTDEEVDLIFRRFDKDSDSFLDFEEFLTLFAPTTKQYEKIMKNKLENFDFNNTISFNSKTILIQFFKVLIENEVKIESNRNRLCSREEFSAYQEFSKIKSVYENKSDFNSFCQYLEENKITTEEIQMKLIFERFDRDKDGKISFYEFVQEITPKNLIFEG